MPAYWSRTKTLTSLRMGPNRCQLWEAMSKQKNHVNITKISKKLKNKTRKLKKKDILSEIPNKLFIIFKTFETFISQKTITNDILIIFLILFILFLSFLFKIDMLISKYLSSLAIPLSSPCSKFSAPCSKFLAPCSTFHHHAVTFQPHAVKFQPHAATFQHHAAPSYQKQIPYKSFYSFLSHT